jgi:hypothetical protein
MINKNIVYILSWGLFIWIHTLILTPYTNDPESIGPVIALILIIEGGLLYFCFAMDISLNWRPKSYWSFLGWPHLLIYLALEYINEIIRDLIPERDNLDELLRLYISKSLRERGYVDFDLFKLAYPPKHYRKINTLFKVYRKELNLIPIYEDGLIIYKRESKFID